MSTILNSSVVESLTPQPSEHKVQNVPRGALMEVFETEAVRLFEKHRYIKWREEVFQERDAILEKKFITMIKQSPSKQTIDYGIVAAVEAGWNGALEEFLSIDLSTYKPIKFEGAYRHSLQKDIVSKLSLPSTDSSKGRGRYVNSALLYAIARGEVDTVEVLARHMDFNIEDDSQDPLLQYVYSLEQKYVKKQMLDIVLPKLEASLINIRMTAKHGDLESTKYFWGKLELSDQSFARVAGTEAILNGHDDIVKWIVGESGVVNWERDGGSLVGAAVECGNLAMIEYLSKHSPGLLLHQFGFSAASTLWDFLQKADRPELFVKFVPSHPDGYSSSS